MNEKIVEIIKPGIYTDLNAYWAMHYCSIFETLYEQKNLAHGFNQGYMENVEPTLGNLASKAGFAFFKDIKSYIQNFGFQKFLCHYLISDEGNPMFIDIVTKISELHSYNFISETQEFGVFISCKDFNSGLRFAVEHNPYLLGYGKLTYQDAASKVAFADLCILLKKNNEMLGILGEVEGNHGEYFFQDSFWNRKKGTYYSFGIGVKQRLKYANQLTSKLNPENTSIIGKWVKTDYGWKYIIIIESDHALIHDFYNAIGTMELFMTLGPYQRANYDASLLPILNLIKQNWNSHILDLIATLRSLLSSSKNATLGSNTLPDKISVVPSIII